MARMANAEWRGNLKEGEGRMAVGSGAFDAPYTFKSRFEEGAGTNPEELIGAAEAGCFSMQVAANLAEAGHTPESVRTTTCWPSNSDIAVATERPITSLLPPAGNGMIISIGRVGQVCACAAPAKKATAATALIKCLRIM
jgi:hypothetical protein